MKTIKVGFLTIEEVNIPDRIVGKDKEIEEFLGVVAEGRGADSFGWSENLEDDFIVC